MQSVFFYFYWFYVLAQFKVFSTADMPIPNELLIIEPLKRWGKCVEGSENTDYVTQGVRRTGGKNSCSTIKTSVSEKKE